MPDLNVRRRLTTDLFFLPALTLGAHDASADDIRFDLYVKNIDRFPVTIKLKDSNTCYQGAVVGTIHEIAPGQTSPAMPMMRSQWHGCDGEGGIICIAFDPPVGANKDGCLSFTNDRQLFEYAEPGHPNPYPGTLQPKDRASNSYTYLTWAHPSVQPSSRPVARWEKVCQQICNRQTTHTVSEEAEKSKGVTEEDKKSLSLSVTAGITPPPTGGPSGGVTWTSGMEQSIARTMNESISRGEIYADTNNYTYTPEQMQQLNIFAIWRFVADTKLINGKMITISTNEFTCTSDANPPMYLPGSSRDKGTCTGSLAK